MKRILNLTLSVLVLGTIAMASARADVDVSLNVVPNNFSDYSQGGSWTLVAKTDTTDSDGIVSLFSRFLDIPAAGTVDPDIGHDINGGVLVIGIFGLQIEFVYGQDPGDGLVLGVGLPGGPSDLGVDPLGDPAWDDASEFAFGNIPDLNLIPVFVNAGANEVFEIMSGGVIQAATIDEMVVRVAVPEPNTAVLGLLAFIGCVRRRRR
jgi:hypothetical protein